MTELNKIYNQDCLEGMKRIPDGSVDLVVTSPPYDNLRTYGHLKGGFTFEMFKPIAKELSRILKEGGVIVWNVNDETIKGSETCTSFRQVLFFKDECGLNLHDTMIFKKTNPIPQIYRKRYNNEFEYMFVFSKGTVKTHNPIKVPCLHAGLQLKGTTYKNFSVGEQTRTKLANPVKEEKIKGNIWEYVVGKKQIDQEAKKHPAPFPFELARDHIVSWSNENDIVLDPFIGSGTTAIAAIRENRHFIGMELNKEYYDIACERIKKEQAEIENSLFSL